LDRREAAISQLESGSRAVVSGDVDQSELYRRITAADELERMPPVDSGKQLSPKQIDVLRRWIEQGAAWNEHWSFRPLREVELPQVERSGWVRNEIDRFVLARLEAEGLAPNFPADREQLIRRVTFDLTGLPPMLEDLEAFLADDAPDAYENVVDRLLNSPAYGERMALQWMDAARYADTHGYLLDSERQMWRWRDWVIAAFNNNMPFDRFTIEQLAGDLLPEPTFEQKIASGFNRNHVINGEFGAIGEEYIVEYVCDRVNTVGTIWMGLTLECARCHDHKYDPISQKEFYELYAFFDNTGENGIDGFLANAGPVMTAPTPSQKENQRLWNERVQQAQSLMTALEPEIAAAQAVWEPQFRQDTQDVRDGLRHYWKLDGDLNDSGEGKTKTALNLGLPQFVPGLFGKSIFSVGIGGANVAEGITLDWDEPFTLSTWVQFSNPHGRRSLMTHMRDGTTLGRGFAFQIHDGRLSLVLAHTYPQSCLEVESEGLVAQGDWQHLAASYDGSGRAAGVKMYINGQRQDVRVLHDSLGGSIDIDEYLIMLDGTPNAALRGQIDEARIYGRVLEDAEVPRILGVSIHSLLAVAPDKRTPAQSQLIREYFLDHAGKDEWNAAYDTLVELKRAKAEFEQTIPTVMVMQELDKPKDAHVLMGGAYDRPGEAVSPGTPDVLPPLPDEFPRDRLGFARWLVSGSNPLTARVVVNRFWQMYFGTGLVKTADDFGSQGEPPSHPDLLDWLAGEFVRSGWDVRAMQRLIVTSATYRQSSQAGPDALARDPENRLLSRGPRFRLHAEFIRDQALAQSGLLSRKLGGPSVKPYQPKGLWREGAWDPTGNKWSAQIYDQDHGEKLYRRSTYTFWKRTLPPPAMIVFDAAERQRCCVTRTRTNTPLQALVLMNDPQFVEASRMLAERMMLEGGVAPEERIGFAFRLMTSRRPSAAELIPLLTLFEKQHARFLERPQAAEAFLSVGESPRNVSLDPGELAAYATVGSVLLNLDETITRN
jgi:hypothetical protein